MNHYNMNLIFVSSNEDTIVLEMKISKDEYKKIILNILPVDTFHNATTTLEENFISYKNIMMTLKKIIRYKKSFLVSSSKFDLLGF